jgi:hypothetical protein
MKETKIWQEPLDKAQRLAQLDLAEDELLQAVQMGQFAAANCTENNPTLQAPIMAWGDTIRALRDTKIPQGGWLRHDEQHLQPLVLNSKKNIAITAAAGDEYTGTNRTPSTKSSKGSLTESAIKSNALKNTLFGDIRKKTRETWILLFFRDKQTFEIRSELSLPVKMNAEKQVDDWLERIILAAIPFSQVPEKASDNQPQAPDIDIKIKRRA